MSDIQVEKQQKKFMRGVMILTPATFIAKLIGLFYKVPLLMIVGVEGMAYFLSAYHVYSLLFVLSASGLPTALSLLVSRAVAGGKRSQVPRIFGVAIGTFMLLGFICAAVLVFFSSPIARALSMAQASSSLLAIAPALFFATQSGAIKGLFQGQGNMLPTALAEVIEAGGKLVFGIAFAQRALQSGADTATVAAAAVFGITVGMALSAVFLSVLLFIGRKKFLKREKQASKKRQGGVLRALIGVAFPVTVSASVMSVVSLLDTALISGRLQALGFAPQVANAMYSSYGNLAVPLYNLVPSLLTPVMLSLTPTLSAAFASKDVLGAKKAFSSALRLVSLVALPASLGLAVFSSPVLSMIYRGQESAVAVSAPLLSLLAPAVFFAVLISVSSAALQAAGKAFVPVWSMCIGAVVKLLAEWILLSVPAIHVYGAPISTLMCNLTVLIINFVVLFRVLPFRPALAKDMFRSLLAAVLAVLLSATVYWSVEIWIGARVWLMPFVLLLTVIVYVLFALLFGAVEKEDLMSIPCGKHICALLERCKLLKEVQKDDKRREITNDFAKRSI